MVLNTERIKTYQDEKIGWIIFNNPNRHNAMSLEMWQGLGDALKIYSETPQIRVVILRGEGGKSFISGADISEFKSERSNSEQKGVYDITMERANNLLSSFEKPIIALIEGYCIGGGLATALQADIRIAIPSSTFGIPAAKLGLGYGIEGLGKLVSIIGPANSRDLMLSARLLNSKEAKNMGLINFVFPAKTVVSKTMEYATNIANNAPLTIRAAKSTINAWETETIHKYREVISKLIDTCFDSKDYQEGLKAFREKRNPQFLGE